MHSTYGWPEGGSWWKSKTAQNRFVSFQLSGSARMSDGREFTLGYSPIIASTSGSLFAGDQSGDGRMPELGDAEESDFAPN